MAPPFPATSHRLSGHGAAQVQRDAGRLSVGEGTCAREGKGLKGLSLGRSYHKAPSGEFGFDVRGHISNSDTQRVSVPQDQTSFWSQE